MSGWSLRLLGVGNASAVELGSAMATIERDGAPWLTIDCGGEGLTAYQRAYGGIPAALFMTHAHMDHIAGFERLFVAGWFDPAHRGEVRLYVPATLLPLLQQRVASYPNALAEGGVNFWDAFRVVPVGDHFWHDGLRFEVFPVRHHWPETAFGLRLRGSVVWTGDTRPIPEMLAKFADADELIAHDCALEGNPSHSGIDDLEREYPPALLARCMLYHYASAEDGEALRARGHRVGMPGEVVPLHAPVVA
ncbi:MBL fold metallo-hydrolase [Thermomonas sp.]|jgi:ribonuclease BN (tRNA processing enzyme)|uniref:MBL fold metallo-hydrolase n=1 Tax=Thermomonas sp. TaxID=1971895 RepID=UPI001B4BD8CB|nr:MBL fold metallo-hydrolase [Thermomonas sp.]MBK6924979.1 MBL fold metallo-hydrolase [Thermomonas sp.]MBL0229192.1 MBL fold metallo-hydrolase [Thermomonas sp.]MBP7158966.1 MBL fold metallo-hydrolase [Thermomonas sp.]